MSENNIYINKIDKTALFDNSSRHRFLTVNEVGQMLAVSERTIRDWVYRNQIPHIKINGALRFSLAELEKWLGGKNNGNRKVA